MSRLKMDEKLKMEMLKEAVYYDPIKGTFTLLVDAYRKKKGERADVKANTFYRAIHFKRTTTLAHRFAFYVMTGKLPKIIDHENRDGTDNRFCNLREAKSCQNTANAGKRAGGSSKYKGVYYCNTRAAKGKDAWVAQISVNGKSKSLGAHPTEVRAKDVYRSYAKIHHAEFYCEN